jgi:CheY-like chemotaxis protein
MVALLFSSPSDILRRASDGQQAIELVGHLDPDVVLIDISMPNMNGVEAIVASRDDFERADIMRNRIETERGVASADRHGLAVVRVHTALEGDRATQFLELVTRRPRVGHFPVVIQQRNQAGADLDTLISIAFMGSDDARSMSKWRRSPSVQRRLTIQAFLSETNLKEPSPAFDPVRGYALSAPPQSR